MARKTNCVINGIEYYRIRKKVGEDEHGKSIFKSFYGKNKSNAEEMVKEWEQGEETGADTKAYMSQVLDQYMTEVFMRGDHSEGTKRRYETAYRLYIKGSDMTLRRMRELNPIVVRTFFNSLMDRGVKYGSLSAVQKILTLFFDWAHDVGYGRTPMPTIKLKKPRKVDSIQVFNDEEIKKIVEGTRKQNDHNHFLIIFALGTGLRQGELLGLKYGDIKGDTIHVERQAITDTAGSRQIDRTKTANAVRDVPMPNNIKERLTEYKAKQPNTTAKDLVFPSKEGNIVDATNLIRSYRRFLDSIGVEYKPFHTLRKTYCTLLCKSGVPIQVASVLMGHSSIAVTAQYYTFVEAQAKGSAADQINGFF